VLEGPLPHAGLLTPIAMVLAVITFVLLVARSAWGLCALIVLYPLEDFVPRGPIPGFNAQTVLVGLALIVTLLKFGVRFPPIRVTAPMLAFAFIMVMGFSVASVGFDGFGPNFGFWTRAKGLKSRLFTALLFVIVYWWARDPKIRRNLLESVSVSLLVVASTVFLDLVTGASGRPKGLFTNSNYTGDVLGIFLIVPVYLVRTADLSPRRRAFHCVAYGLAAISLLLTLARGAWLGAFASHCVWLFYERKQVAAIAVGATVLLATAAYPLVPTFVRDRIERTFEGGAKRYALGGALGQINLESSAATRLVLYRAGFEIWRESPLWGSGLETFRFKILEYGPKYGLFASKTTHSLPLKLVTEMGLIGLIGMFWSGLVLLSVGRRALRIRGDPENKLGALVIAVAISTFVANLFHGDFLLSATSSGYFWVIFGLVARYQYTAERAQAVPYQVYDTESMRLAVVR